MEYVASHRVALDVLDDAELSLAVDLELDDGVEAGIGGDRTTKVGPFDRDRHRVLLEAVDDGGDSAACAQAAAGPGADGAARGRC